MQACSRLLCQGSLVGGAFIFEQHVAHILVHACCCEAVLPLRLLHAGAQDCQGISPCTPAWAPIISLKAWQVPCWSWLEASLTA